MATHEEVKESLKEIIKDVDVVGYWKCPLCGTEGSSRKEWWTKEHRKTHRDAMENKK